MSWSTGTHILSDHHPNTISGKPDELFLLPENKGGEDKLHSVSPEGIEFAAENLLKFDEQPNIHQEYFEYLVVNMNLQKASNWREALSLYKELLDIFTQRN